MSTKLNPAGQDLHAAMPSASAYFPLSQALHNDILSWLLTPVSGFAVPGLHFKGHPVKSPSSNPDISAGLVTNISTPRAIVVDMSRDPTLKKSVVGVAV